MSTVAAAFSDGFCDADENSLPSDMSVVDNHVIRC
jgi:hypothetical protein